MYVVSRPVLLSALLLPSPRQPELSQATNPIPRHNPSNQIQTHNQTNQPDTPPQPIQTVPPPPLAPAGRVRDPPTARLDRRPAAAALGRGQVQLLRYAGWVVIMCVEMQCCHAQGMCHVPSLSHTHIFYAFYFSHIRTHMYIFLNTYRGGAARHRHARADARAHFHGRDRWQRGGSRGERCAAPAGAGGGGCVCIFGSVDGWCRLLVVFHFYRHHPLTHHLCTLQIKNADGRPRQRRDGDAPKSVHAKRLQAIPEYARRWVEYGGVDAASLGVIG